VEKRRVEVAYLDYAQLGTGCLPKAIDVWVSWMGPYA